jgi:hypothetical protein
VAYELLGGLKLSLKHDIFMSDKIEFGLVEPFEIDDGSLRHVSPEYAFALGVEWAMFREQLSTGKRFIALCLPENRTRFVRMAERHRRFVEDRPTACVDWIQIWIGDSIGCEPLESEPK